MDESLKTRLDRALEIFADRPALWVALRAVCDHPHQVLKVETPYVGVGEAKNLEASLLGVSALESGALAYTEHMRHFTSRGEKWRFLKVFDRRVVQCDDNDANRFVAFFVRSSLKLLKQLSFAAAADDTRCDYFQEILHLVRRMNLVLDALSPTFKYARLRVLPLDNQLLQFHPQYHVILESYLACESL